MAEERGGRGSGGQRVRPTNACLVNTHRDSEVSHGFAKGCPAPLCSAWPPHRQHPHLRLAGAPPRRALHRPRLAHLQASGHNAYSRGGGHGAADREQQRRAGRMARGIEASPPPPADRCLPSQLRCWHTQHPDPPPPPTHLLQPPQQQLAPVGDAPPLQLQLALALPAARAQAASGAAAAPALARAHYLRIAFQPKGRALAGGGIHNAHLGREREGGETEGEGRGRERGARAEGRWQGEVRGLRRNAAAALRAEEGAPGSVQLAGSAARMLMRAADRESAADRECAPRVSPGG